MKFTYKWLMKFLDTRLTPDEIGVAMTNIGIEVESIVDPSEALRGFSVAYIEEANSHPNADKLKICKISTKNGTRQVVCGAANARSGLKVVLADIGVKIPNGGFEIKLSKIRGEESYGMLCSYEELNLEGDKGGIIELSSDAAVGDLAAKYLGVDDVIYDVSVTPNRGDWLGVYGIARDLAAKGLGAIKKLEDVDISILVNGNSLPANANFPPASASVATTSNSCSLLALIEITNLNNSSSPEWLQQLLKNIGITPISALVDITNYFSVSFARPLHAYDANKINGNLVARKALDGEAFTDLVGKQYKLSSEDLVIADSRAPQSIAGIIGGMDSKCTKETSSIILESACFDKISVTKSGRRHNIITDARARFERGIDDAETINMLKRATNMIIEICGGSVKNISITGSLPEARPISFDHKLIESRIGIKIDIEESQKILNRLGFTQDQNNIGSYRVPSWRHDINCPEILAEEIARIFGFENIEPKPLLQEVGFKAILEPSQKKLDELRRLTASIGYQEVVTLSFMSSKYSSFFFEIDKNLRINNPISQDLDYMRVSIVPNLLEIAAKNNARSIPDISIFEVGPVFSGLMPENEHLVMAGLISGISHMQAHYRPKKDVEFFDIKSDVNRIITESGININSLKITQSSAKYCHPGRSASYFLGKNLIAHFGEIHPEIAKLFSLEAKVCAFEIFLDNIPAQKIKMARRPDLTLSPYQIVSRDFAYIFAEDMEAGEMLRKISLAERRVKKVEIFDIYSGDTIGKNRKSIAFRVKIQSDTETLRDTQIEEIVLQIMSIAEQFGGEIRK
ncbi:MAG: phenylalanine--tRNA ligase subunit beta [Alphaproteobacteria bacterium]|nr:phenylalanine--tRNA ligase subunit beta [Alphaproteobacteria bacterium]